MRLFILFPHVVIHLLVISKIGNPGHVNDDRLENKTQYVIFVDKKRNDL